MTEDLDLYLKYFKEMWIPLKACQTFGFIPSKQHGYLMVHLFDCQIPTFEEYKANRLHCRDANTIHQIKVN